MRTNNLLSHFIYFRFQRTFLLYIFVVPKNIIMKPEEMFKKDWLLLTAYSDITILSYVKSILENQAVIISELTKRPLSEITEEIEKNRQENYTEFMKSVKDNIPNHNDRPESIR